MVVEYQFIYHLHGVMKSTGQRRVVYSGYTAACLSNQQFFFLLPCAPHKAEPLVQEIC